MRQIILKVAGFFSFLSPFAFHVVVRPRGCGVTGIRNYYADESGIIRGTPGDREATRDDPPIPECEWHEHTLCSLPL